MAQYNMVEQQIRPWNVHSSRLLRVITELDRAQFVPDKQWQLCCVDTRISLGGDAQMLEPKVAARLVQALDIKPEDRVLLVGAGSGYTAAICAKLANFVDCIDPDQAALDQAKTNVEAASISNIELQLQNEAASDPAEHEYDAILIREARATAPEALFSYLPQGGRCVSLVGKGYVMELMRYTRNGKQMESESIVDILKPLKQSAVPEQVFVF